MLWHRMAQVSSALAPAGRYWMEAAFWLSSLRLVRMSSWICILLHILPHLLQASQRSEVGVKSRPEAADDGSVMHKYGTVPCWYKRNLPTLQPYVCSRTCCINFLFFMDLSSSRLDLRGKPHRLWKGKILSEKHILHVAAPRGGPKGWLTKPKPQLKPIWSCLYVQRAVIYKYRHPGTVYLWSQLILIQLQILDPADWDQFYNLCFSL